MTVLVVCLALAAVLLLFVARSIAKGGGGSEGVATAPKHLGAVWADSAEAKAVLKQGRETKPTLRWRCCRCGAGFLLTIHPDLVPVPWWYWEKGATWNHTEKDPVAWACPDCGTYAYTVPLK